MIKYYRQGYKPFVINPPLWLAVKLNDWFGLRTLRSTDITFELLDPNKDQVTYHSPWSDCY
jgi:hypothetical protein